MLGEERKSRGAISNVGMLHTEVHWYLCPRVSEGEEIGREA
jgi:hypothetical protein